MRLAIQSAPRVATKYDADQRRFLVGALENFVKGDSERGRRYREDSSFLRSAPRFVLAAKRTVELYIKAARKEYEKPFSARMLIAKRIEEEMLFGDPRKAMLMLRKAKKK